MAASYGNLHRRRAQPMPNVFQVASNRVGNFNPGASWALYGYTAHVNEWTLNP